MQETAEMARSWYQLRQVEAVVNSIMLHGDVHCGNPVHATIHAHCVETDLGRHS